METPQTRPARNNRLWWLLAAGAVALLLLYLVVQFWLPLWAWLSPYYEFASNKKRVKAAVKAAGLLGPLVFIGLQALQVIFAPIPGEASGFLGGFLFGAPLGMFFSTVGLTIGSAGAFLLGRWLEKRFVARMVSPETMERFDFLMERQGALVSFILFLIPGFPKDYLCFILGLSPMDFRVFLVISTIGRLPGTLMLSLQGAQVYKGNYWNTVLLLAVSVVLAGLALIYREKLYCWLRRLETYRRKGKTVPSDQMEKLPK
ncbi:MAG: TVP38/TMEM64 family protein [Desulfobaccales bacterium]